MKVHSNILKTRQAMLLSSAMLVVTLPLSSAWAADQAPLLKAPPAPVVDQGWYFDGSFETGGRFVFDRPGTGFVPTTQTLPAVGGAPAQTIRTFVPASGTDSIAKFEQYGKIPEAAPFLDWVNLNWGSKDGKYAFDFWARNVALDNQSYGFDASIVGMNYFTVGWDQIPYLISTSAKTIFQGSGGTLLTVDPNLRAYLTGQGGAVGGATAAGLTARRNVADAVDGNSTNIELGTRRDKFVVGDRWTPTPEWDVKVDYSHEDRTGTRPYSFQQGSGLGHPVEVARPIDDTTQNANASGEYYGITPWGTKFNSMVKYTGSFYDQNIGKFEAQNPFSTTGLLRSGEPPSNQSNAVALVLGTDIPIFKTHYSGTTSFAKLTQTEAFMDTSINGLVSTPMSRPDLQGDVHTFLTNHVINSKFTNDVWNTVRVRYYERKNETADIVIPAGVVLRDSTPTTAASTIATDDFTSWNRTNVSDDVRWRTPLSWLTLGAGGAWERYERSPERAAQRTDEWAGKFNFVAHPWSMVTARADYQYSERRYDTYDDPDIIYVNSRMFDMSNRNRHKASGQVDFAVGDWVTVTPSFGLRFDEYTDPVQNLLGISRDNSWNAGVEVSGQINQTLRVMASYTYEPRKLDMAAAVPDAGSAAICAPGAGTFATPACTWQDSLDERYHTILTAVDWKAIPNKLDFRFEYLWSQATDAHGFSPCSGGFANCINGVSPTSLAPISFPDNKSTLNRFNVVGRYYVDPDLVRSLGWNGQVVAKVRYTWERNTGNYWASDQMQPYNSTLNALQDLSGAAQGVYLAYQNPNYTAQLITASLAFKW